MATNLIYVFALMLALNGLGGSSSTGNPPTSGGTFTADGVTGTPVPTCGPNDPNHCGLD